MVKKTNTLNWLQTTAVRLTRVHFFYIAAYIVAIIIYDSWNLLTHDAVAQRWTWAGAFLALNAIFWYTARMKFANEGVYIAIVLALTTADIAFAGMNVFWERGIASKAVILFAVPIITAATLRSRSTLLAITTLSAAVYSIATVRYFFIHYGESYRIELWGTVGFYCAAFFALAFLLLIIIKPSSENF